MTLGTLKKSDQPADGESYELRDGNRFRDVVRGPRLSDPALGETHLYYVGVGTRFTRFPVTVNRHSLPFRWLIALRVVTDVCQLQGSSKPLDAVLQPEFRNYPGEEDPGDEDLDLRVRDDNGTCPLWFDSALVRQIRPAAKRATVTKHIGWHTFRHSVASPLVKKGTCEEGQKE